MSSHNDIDCRFCKKSMRSDKYLRHCKSQHAVQMASSMTDEERRSAIRNKAPIVIAALARRVGDRTERLPVMSLCVVCCKGRHTQYDDKRGDDVVNFLDTHTSCSSKFDEVAYLFDSRIPKPKAKPRGKAVGKKVASESTTAAPQQPAATEASSDSLKRSIVDMFPQIFDQYDYETDEDGEEEDIEDAREERTKQRGFSQSQMLEEIAKVFKAQQKRILQKPAVSCAACKTKDAEVDVLEQNAYMLRQEIDTLHDNIDFATKQSDRTIEQLRAENAELRKRLTAPN